VAIIFLIKITFTNKSNHYSIILGEKIYQKSEYVIIINIISIPAYRRDVYKGWSPKEGGARLSEGHRGSLAPSLKLPTRQFFNARPPPEGK
jgi:hypothetical protein